MRTALLLPVLALPFSAPGQRIFQQRVDHAIDVRLDDKGHVLRGEARFTYHNNSPTALDTLWVHLWPNAYTDRNTALCHQLDVAGELDLHFAREEDRGRIDSLDFRAEDSPLIWGYHPQHADIGWVKLPAPLPTGGSITISTPFRVKVPKSRFSRLGHTGQAYHITQWYPKPAVFDAEGWHPMPYLTQGEFYSDFGRYDVRITLPANYVVGATGMLQDASERRWMDSLAVLPAPAEKRPKGTAAFPPSDSVWKTLRFVQDSVHDFAWFADKRFVVRKGEVVLPTSGRTVTTWALATPRNAALWENAVRYLNDALLHYSHVVGDYPYAACTAVDGTISAGGGMEYPMITIIGNMSSAESLDNVIAHEVGHNWFQGVLASNERDHPWMDEGLNSYLELRYMRARYPRPEGMLGLPGERRLMRHFHDPHRAQSELAMRLNTRRDLDQSSTLPSTQFTPTNYGTMVYMRTSLVMDHLEAYLGTEVMDRCLHAYFEEWAFRHPGPQDLRAVFERVSGKDLGWAFEQLLGSTRKVDVKARKLKDGVLHYALDDRSYMPFPVSVHGDPGRRTFWVEPDSTRQVRLPWPDVDRIRIDAEERTLDIDRRNNGVRAHGPLRRWTAPRLAPFVGLEREDRRSTWLSPAMAWNAHDGFMAGLALHNATFPMQRVEWALAPLYGLRSERPVGGARLFWHHDRLERGPVGNVHLGVTAQSASLFVDAPLDRWYLRVSPQLTVDLRNDPARRRASHSIGYRAVVLRETLSGPVGDTLTIDRTNEDIYHELTYRLQDRTPLLPRSVRLDVQHHAAFTRVALEVRQAFVYDARKHRVAFRLFTGQFLRTDDRLMQRQMGWRLHWGSSDMTFDHLFMDRQDVGRNTAQQMAKDQGAFRVPTAQGTSDSWIAALNMEADMPFVLPLSVYASAGAAPYTEVTSTGRTEKWRMHAEAGIGIRIIRDVAEVWVPLVFTREIADELALRDVDFAERIRFVLALEKLNPFELIRSIRP